MDFSNQIEGSAESDVATGQSRNTYQLPKPRGFNTFTSPNRPLNTADTILRLAPAIFAIPTLTLYCIDLAEYHRDRRDGFILEPSKKVSVVDALAIAFFVISAVIPPVRIIRWTVAKSRQPSGIGLDVTEQRRPGFASLTMSPFWWFGVDFVLWMCCLVIACTTLALRSSDKNCRMIGWFDACSHEALNRMRAAGGLGIVTAVFTQFLWLIPMHMRYDRLFEKEGAWGVDRPPATQ